MYFKPPGFGEYNYDGAVRKLRAAGFDFKPREGEIHPSLGLMN